MQLRERHSAIVIGRRLLQLKQGSLEALLINIFLDQRIRFLLALHLLLIGRIHFLILHPQLVLVDDLLLDGLALLVDEQVLVRVPYLLDLGVRVEIVAF